MTQFSYRRFVWFGMSANERACTTFLRQRVATDHGKSVVVGGDHSYQLDLTMPGIIPL